MGTQKNQELFDFCSNHMRKQGKRSLIFFHGETIPAYKGFNNTTDPVQAIIDHNTKNNIYIPEWENQTCKEQKFIKFLLEQWGYDIKLAFAFQQLHDTVIPECWEAGFESIAHRWHLIYINPIKSNQYLAFSTYIKITIPSRNGDDKVENICHVCENICKSVHESLCKRFPEAEVNIGGNTKPCPKEK